MPPEVRIEPHLATKEEIAALAHAVGWAETAVPEAAPRIQEVAVFGVTARVNEQAIGSAAITTDQCGFYYIRDVMVHPDWQGRHVGTALLQALMDYLHTHAPDNTLVGLFTGPTLHHFYARAGFQGATTGLYGMTQTIRR